MFPGPGYLSLFLGPEELSLPWMALFVAVDAERQEVLHPFFEDAFVCQVMDVVCRLDLAVGTEAVAHRKPAFALLLPSLGSEVFPVLATPLAPFASPAHVIVLGETVLSPLLV